MWESQPFDWLSSCELQPITFNLYLIHDLLITTRYHLRSSFAQYFCNLSFLDPDSHKGCLCLITRKKALSWTNRRRVFTPQLFSANNQHPFVGYLVHNHMNQTKIHGTYLVKIKCPKDQLVMLLQSSMTDYSEAKYAVVGIICRIAIDLYYYQT